MVTFSELGNFGRLGNQLFQIAATISTAIDNGLPFCFPEWKYQKYFKNKLPLGTVEKWNEVTELNFRYNPITLDIAIPSDMKGYFQSENNFKKHEHYIRYYFQFSKQLLNKSYDSTIGKFLKETVCIHIRRGDYVGNDNYAAIPLDYYYRAMQVFGSHVQFMVFSDDIHWCKGNLKTDRALLFSEGQTEIEDLALMTLCDHFIIPNSSFGWWAAWLGEKKHSTVIAPDEWFSGLMKYKNNAKDIIPDRWTKFPVTIKPAKPKGKIDLQDVTFTIPIKYDHPHREENINIIIDFLTHHFDTNILVMESDVTPKLTDLHKKNCTYAFYPMVNGTFHRTKLLNLMALNAKTPIICNYDCDVVFQPEQILAAVNKLRNKECSGVLPYDGMFLRAMRQLDQFRETFDLTDLNLSASHKIHYEQKSFGGCILWNREDFITGGMENENMISWGPEDYERCFRFELLGFKIQRVDGPLIHINHFMGDDSGPDNPNFKKNCAEYEKIQKMSSVRLKEYVNTWTWMKTLVKA